MDERRWLKQREVEARYGISAVTVWRWVREGILPSPWKPRRNLNLFSREALDKVDRAAMKGAA